MMKSTWIHTAYPVPGVDLGTAGQQILHNVGVACSCGHMQRSTIQLQSRHWNTLCLCYLHTNPPTNIQRAKCVSISIRPTICSQVHKYESRYKWRHKKNTFTLSLTFKSAPWVFRTLTTSRLPPLQAQCMALEPSWNTVGGPPCY